jgi:formamidopyrimidine-DNA glycosylase
MPELPDITVYIEALKQRISGHTLIQAQIASPFLLRTVDPPVSACVGHAVSAICNVGKRIAIGFDNEIWLVLHLMIAGRLHWVEKARKPDGRRTLAAFLFDNGCLTLTEAGSQKRASLHIVGGHMGTGKAGLAALDPGGMDVMTASLDEFAHGLTVGNHTLKRALTDPRVFSGIGNAYSDEILHRARLSPITLTSRLTAEEIATLHAATQGVLQEWVERLRAEAAGGFPEKVTAFREEMAVHGRYGLPCPRCGSKIQRIRYASNETNYCAVCQTGGRLLADRALSRLLGKDWPRTLEELEDLRSRD